MAFLRDELSFTMIFTTMQVQKITAIILLSLLTSCSVSKNPLRKQVKLLQKEIIRDDTSYVYALPFDEEKTFRVIILIFRYC